MSQDSRQDSDDRPRNGDEQDVPEPVRRHWRRLGNDEPPALVDQSVLNRARAAVEGEAPRSSRPWSFGWIHTVTTAAVIVLGVTVVLQLGEPTAPPPPAALEPDVTPAEVTADSTPKPLRAPQTTPAAERARSVAPTAASESETMLDAAQAPREVVRQAAPGEEASGEGSGEPAESSSRAASGVNPADTPPEPGAWLAQIRALFAAGQESAARAELERFRRAWPDHPLPDDFPEALRTRR